MLCTITLAFLMNALPVSHPHYPFTSHHILASLVKGRWLDGKAQTIALLLPACYIPTLFILQTFLPSRQRDCFTPPTLPNPHYPMPRTKLARPRKKVRFCCSVKPSQLWWGLLPIRTIIEIFRTIPRKPPTPLPLNERFVGFASL